MPTGQASPSAPGCRAEPIQGLQVGLVQLSKRLEQRHRHGHGEVEAADALALPGLPRTDGDSQPRITAVQDLLGEPVRLATEQQPVIAGIADRVVRLFRMAAEMEDGVANAPRRSTSLLLAASAYAAHGHYAATSECAMQALLTTTATLFLPCQRRPEISQLSDLEAARVIVLSHYHLGTSQQRLGNVDGSKDCKYALEMAARFFGQGSTVYHGMYSAILADGRLRDLVNGHTLAPPPLQSDAMWSTNAGALFDGSLGFGGGVSRSTAAMLGADVTRNAFGDSALASAAVASSEKETLDIRNILSNPLPPLPSDVDFVRSEASLASTGALRAQFQLLC